MVKLLKCEPSQEKSFLYWKVFRIRLIKLICRCLLLLYRCCRINVLLVTMQVCLGGMVTALAFYMETLTPTLGIRECPYWAGIPVSIHYILVAFSNKDCKRVYKYQQLDKKS